MACNIEYYKRTFSKDYTIQMKKYVRQYFQMSILLEGYKRFSDPEFLNRGQFK